MPNGLGGWVYLDQDLNLYAITYKIRIVSNLFREHIGSGSSSQHFDNECLLI